MLLLDPSFFANWGGGGGGGGLPLNSKVISMLVVFLGYTILVLVFFRVGHLENFVQK